MKTNERGVMAHRRQVVVVGYERKHNGRDPQWDHYVLYAQEIGNRDPELRYWLSNGYTVCEAVSDKAFREARRKAAQHSRAGSLQGLVRTTSEFRRWLSPAVSTTSGKTCKGPVSTISPSKSSATRLKPAQIGFPSINSLS